LTWNVIPETESFTVGVSAHCEGVYVPLMLTGMVDWYAVIGVGAAVTFAAEKEETKIMRRVRVARIQPNFALDSNFAHACGPRSLLKPNR
jgi:hypothetical protein